MNELTHFDDSGNARMVDVGEKANSRRVAVASGVVQMKPTTLERIENRDFAKGDVLSVARLAGIMATKQTANLIPLCHPLRIDSVDIGFETVAESSVRLVATVAAFDRTGVEMEALTAVTTAALTIYDMCKSVDRTMQVTDIRLEQKSGGSSGEFRRDGEVGSSSH